MKGHSGKRSRRDLREPGFWESLREQLFGSGRLLDCVQVEVSSRCPGRCRYCPHTTMSDDWLSRDMDLETFSALWPLLRRSSRVHLQGWGEPLVNPAFFDLAALARKAGCAVSTTTCGLIMTPELAEKLVASGLDIIAFSLAGTDPTSNAVRRGVDFDRVCEAVSTLQDVRRRRMGVHLEIHFAYLMLASDMEAVRGLPGLMRQLGVHAAVISTLDFLPGAEWDAEAVLPDDTEKVARAAAILKETEMEARRFDLGFHYALPRPEAPGDRCRENIARSLFVSADGLVSPCVYLNVPARRFEACRGEFGSIRTRDPLEIWQGETLRSFRERMAAGEPDGRCLACVKRFQCP